MVTTYRHVVYDKHVLDIRGLSTDNKPTVNIPNGSTFIEMDSGKIYFYDADSNEWKEF